MPARPFTPHGCPGVHKGALDSCRAIPRLYYNTRCTWRQAATAGSPLVSAPWPAATRPSHRLPPATPSSSRRWPRRHMARGARRTTRPPPARRLRGGCPSTTRTRCPNSIPPATTSTGPGTIAPTACPRPSTLPPTCSRCPAQLRATPPSARPRIPPSIPPMRLAAAHSRRTRA